MQTDIRRSGCIVLLLQTNVTEMHPALLIAVTKSVVVGHVFQSIYMP